MQAEFYPWNEKYKSPVGGVQAGENFTISLVCHGADTAYFALTKEGRHEQTVFYPMRKEGGRFSLTMLVTTPGLYFYRFLVSGAEGECYIGKDATDMPKEHSSGQWQLTAYESRYKPPTLFDGGIIYQIMVDRFCVGGERLKTKKTAVYRDDWYGCPEHRPDEKGVVKNNDFFGGNLDGVTQKLDYLASLSVKCIYLNPIFEAASNHKYDTGNYMTVDGDFGGDEALKRLIDEAAKRGISVMLDGVFSHTGDDSVYFNRYGNYDGVGAFQSKHSPYYAWYDFQEHPSVYTSWWGINTLPCVNENNPEYNEFINGENGVVKKYMRMGVAGFRLDVADELPDEFLDNLTAAVKSVNERGVVLGEVWEDASNKVSYSVRRRYLRGRQLDSVTNYPLKNAIIRFVLCGDEQDFLRVVYSLINNYPKRVLDNLMNMLGTHDTARILTELSGEDKPRNKDERASFSLSDRKSAVERLKIASVLQYTLPGVPCVYYGDEAGMEGCEDPFNRRCYPWGKEDNSLIRHYQALGVLRERSELNGGVFDVVYAHHGVLTYSRGGSLFVTVNLGKSAYGLGEEVTDLVTGEKKSVLSLYSFAVYTK